MKDAAKAKDWADRVRKVADQVERDGNPTLADELRALVDEVHTNGSSWY